MLPNSKKTYLYDCIRSPFHGMIYSGLMTITMLVAIHYFGASTFTKSIIASGESMGRLMCPLVIYLAYKSGLKTSYIASFCMLCTSISLLFAALVPYLYMYTFFIILTYVFFTQIPQFMVHIYSKNYLDKERGSKVSMIFFISTIFGSIFSFILSKSLDKNFTNYHYQFIIIAICSFICSIIYYQIPSTPLQKSEAGNPWKNISLMWKDKLFGYLSIGYMLLGLGHAMVIPVRVEYLTNNIYNINASSIQITLINIVIPGIFMILSTKIWGKFFDIINFIKIRLIINIFFIISFLLFFSSKQFYTFILSSIFNGIATGGGILVWQLWVTKIAPKNKIPAYMSANGAYSGIKGIIAPFLGFRLIKNFTPKTVGSVASLLMIISSIILVVAFKDHNISKKENTK